MLFQMFNLKDEIIKYNRKYNTNYNESESFGFHYFTSENLVSANTYLNLINQGESIFIFSSEGGRFVKKLNSATRKLKLDLTQSRVNQTGHKRGAIYNNTPYTPEEIRYFEDENKKNKQWADNLKKQASSLSDEIFWVIHKKISNIEQIKTLWLKNNVLAIFNDTSIFKIASEALPQLIAYHKEAFIELSKNKQSIPKEIYNAYLDYLKDFQERATKMQRLLVDSMLTRLKAHDVSKGAYSNPVIYINDLIKPSFERPYQPSPLPNKIFDFYHQYIRLHGKYEQKKELYQRRWYTSLNNIHTTLIKTADGDALLVPEVLAKDVPLKKRWPNWIFWAANLRHNLFKDNISLIATLKGRVEINQLFIDLKIPEPFIIALTEANNRGQHIKESLSQLNQYQSKYKFLSWFSPTTKEFLDGWKKILMDQQKIVNDDKIALARRIIDSFRTELHNKDLPENVPWSAIESLLKLKDDLEKMIENDKTLEGRVYSIQTILTQIDRLTRCHKMLALISNHKTHSEDDLNNLLNFITNVQNEDNEIYTAFIEHTKPLFHKIKANLINELQVDPFKFKSAQERNSHQSSIVITSALLEKVSNLNEYQELDELILKYTLNHLQHITINNNKQDLVSNAQQCDNIKVSENILKLIGCIATWQDKPLNTYLDDLQKEKAISTRSYIAKCNNLIKQLTLYFNDKELSHDLTRLDEELVHVLKGAPYSYTTQVIERIFVIRDSLANGKSYESLSLSVSDKNILGINIPEREHIWELIKQSVRAKQVHITLKNHQVSYSNKIHEIETLRASFSKFLNSSAELPDSIKCKQWFKAQQITPQSNHMDVLPVTIKV